MNLFKSLVLSLVLSSSLAAMNDNDNSSLSDVNDSTSTQTDWVTTTPSGN